MVAGLILLALGGYLGPVIKVASTPFIAVQRWVSTRYVTVYELFRSPQDVAALRQRVGVMEQENARLQSQVIELQQQLKDTAVLYSLLKFASARPSDTYVSASVIGRDPSPFLRYLFIDHGSDDGLRRGMPVVNAQGLVGRIDAVTSNAARVQLINDPGSAVNVRLSSSQTEGILVGTITGEVAMQMIPQEAKLDPGEIVLTSALGGNYPANILVGQVVSVRKLETELFQTATIQPSVDFADLRVVLVVTSFAPVDVSPIQPSTSNP